jgi:alpha-L-fucosidase
VNVLASQQPDFMWVGDVVSNNGTRLLTVGPKGDGRIPQRQQARLIAMAFS